MAVKLNNLRAPKAPTEKAAINNNPSMGPIIGPRSAPVGMLVDAVKKATKRDDPKMGDDLDLDLDLDADSEDRLCGKDRIIS